MESAPPDSLYFESEHLALRGNTDYSEMLKTLFILCAQREKATKDYEIVAELKREAINDPLAMLGKIQNNDLRLPTRFEVPKAPYVNWSNYSVKIPEECLKSIENNENKPKPKTEIKSTKAHTKWSAEEQKRLEELLRFFPPEEIEFRRWKKIADALGNRTYQQVQSRVQKYFKKLHLAGLPIPGRIPKGFSNGKKWASKQHPMIKPTTFFPDLYVPVKMNEYENTPGPSFMTNHHTAAIKAPETNENYLLPKTHETDDSKTVLEDENKRKLQLLQRIRYEKVKTNSNQRQHKHIGYKCDYCEEDPILGTRWHCGTCKSDSVDFCNDCFLLQMCSGSSHPVSHDLRPYIGEGEPDNDFNAENQCLQENESSESSDSGESEDET